MFSTKRANRLMMIMLFISTITPYILGPIIKYFIDQHHFNYNITSRLVLSQWVIIFIPIVLYFIITRTSLKRTLLFRKMSLINIALVIALSFTIQPAMALINLISQLFVKNQIGNALLDAVDQPYWLLLALVALSPAIVEELFMRGIILSNYRNKTLFTTCMINGIFFGIFHMNINQCLYAFFLGAMFCFILHLTESLYSTMIMHFIINGTNVSLLKFIYWAADFFEDFYPNYKEEIEKAANAEKTLETLLPSILFISVLFIIGAALSVLIIWGLMHHNKKMHVLKENPLSRDLLNLPEEDAPEEDNKVLTPSFYIAISLFLFFVISNEFGFNLIQVVIDTFSA